MKRGDRVLYKAKVLTIYEIRDEWISLAESDSFFKLKKIEIVQATKLHKHLFGSTDDYQWFYKE